MALAPEPYFSASHGCRPQHPHLVQNWEHCDEGWLRQCLRDYDQKWGHTGGSLIEAYERKLKR
jgi:hypothetical protein